MCASAESSRLHSMPWFARPSLSFIIGWASFYKYGCEPPGFWIRGSLEFAGGLSWRRNTGGLPTLAPARALLGPILPAVYARLAVTPALPGGRLSLASLFLLI